MFGAEDGGTFSDKAKRRNFPALGGKSGRTSEFPIGQGERILAQWGKEGRESEIKANRKNHKKEGRDP